MYGYLARTTVIAHHGIKGMKWGVRRFENPDGTLTEAGKKRYYKSDGTLTKKGTKEIPNSNYSDEQQKRDQSIYGTRGVKRINAELNRGNMISGARSLEAQRVEKKEKNKKVAKKALKIGAGVTATALTVLYAIPSTRSKMNNMAYKGINKASEAFDKIKNKKAYNYDEDEEMSDDTTEYEDWNDYFNVHRKEK